MRMILGLDRPTAGSVTVNGQPFVGLYSAMREVGASRPRISRIVVDFPNLGL